jgi:hypothetical protein
MKKHKQKFIKNPLMIDTVGYVITSGYDGKVAVWDVFGSDSDVHSGNSSNFPNKQKEGQ